MSDVVSLTDAYDMMLRIGELTGKAPEAAGLVQEIKEQFALHFPPLAPGLKPATFNFQPSTFNFQLSTFTFNLQLSTLHPLRVAYFIWRKPYMAAGSGTFIHEMLQVAGLDNVFGDRPRYPEISPDELAAARPEVILLSSEPYPFREKHFGAFREVCPAARVHLVDGEMFSWYGSRLLKSPHYMSELRKNLHPV